MPFFEKIIPLPLCSPGAIWRDDQLQFSLYTEVAEEVEYFFYAFPFQVQTGKAHPLLTSVALPKAQFCFGNS